MTKGTGRQAEGGRRKAHRTPTAIVILVGLSAVAGAAPARKTEKPAQPALTYGGVIVLDTPEPARWHGERISLDLKDADIRDVLSTFAKLEKLNLAIDPEVKGSVTLRLENVPWDQALDVILRMNGLGFVLDGRILRVGKPSKL